MVGCILTDVVVLLKARIGRALALLVLLASSAAGWNGTGHMVIAGIAYQELSEAKRQEFVALLRYHPDFDKWVASKPDNLSQSDLGRYIFMRASTWPTS